MSKVRPKLKSIHSPDILDLEAFQPEDDGNFCFLLQAMFGSEDAEGEESFDIVVCTPQWLEQNMSKDELVVGRHHLIVKEYNIERLRSFLSEYGRQCEADSWDEAAQRLSRISKWEFEDYVAYSEN